MTDARAINDAETVYFEIITKRKNHNLIYRERLIKKNEKYVLLLDFDGFENEVPPKDCLEVADELHEIIEREYFKTIEEPVKERGARE